MLIRFFFISFILLLLAGCSGSSEIDELRKSEIKIVRPQDGPKDLLDVPVVDDESENIEVYTSDGPSN